MYKEETGFFLLVLRGQPKKLFLLLEHLALRYQSVSIV